MVNLEGTNLASAVPRKPAEFHPAILSVNLGDNYPKPSGSSTMQVMIF
jgi:hypothetical protein